MSYTLFYSRQYDILILRAKGSAENVAKRIGNPGGIKAAHFKGVFRSQG